MKKILGIIAIVALVVFVFFKLKANKETIDANTEAALNIEKYDYIPVTVHPVNSEQFANSIEEIGSFQSRQDLTVYATANGRLLSLNAREGQYLSKGQVIATIEHAALSSQLATAKASLANAKKDLERVQNANSVGATTKMQIEQAQLQVENLQSSIDGLNEQIKFFTVTAPMSGYITKTMMDKGSFAMAGSPILEMVDISTIKMVVKVDERIVPLLKVGKSIPITTEVFPGKTFNGKISRIGVKADASKKFEVDIDLANPNNQFKAGMYGKAYFENLSSSDAIYIPRSAIVGSVSEAKVYVVTPDSTVQIIPIQVGGYQGNNIEVTEGLKNGDQVVVMGQINLREGVKVAVVK